jgi:hypothetical protein
VDPTERELIEKCDEYIATSARAAREANIRPPAQSDIITCIQKLVAVGTPESLAAIERVTKGPGIYAQTHRAAVKALELAGSESAVEVLRSMAQAVDPTVVAQGLLRRGLRPFIWAYLLLGGLGVVVSLKVGEPEAGSGEIYQWSVLQFVTMLAIGGSAYVAPSRTALAVAGAGMGLIGAWSAVPIVYFFLYRTAISPLVIVGAPAALLGLYLAVRAHRLSKSLRKLR